MKFEGQDHQNFDAKCVKYSIFYKDHINHCWQFENSIFTQKSANFHLSVRSSHILLHQQKCHHRQQNRPPTGRKLYSRDKASQQALSWLFTPQNPAPKLGKIRKVLLACEYDVCCRWRFQRKWRHSLGHVIARWMWRHPALIVLTQAVTRW